MAENSAIEWTDHTFNPWTGCTAVSPACDHCYAEAWAKRSGRDFSVRKRTKTWGDPVRWNDQHQEFFAVHGRRQRVFCASLADVFDNQAPDEWRVDLFRLIAETPNLDWLLLTKRIGNAAEMMRAALGVISTDVVQREIPNVWLGATVCNQAEADRDIPKLLATPAAVRFLSIEPMLGPIDLRLVTKVWAPGRCNHCCNGDRCDDPSHYSRQHCPHCRGSGRQPVDWVICGGESGPKARPMHPDWARSLRDQCAAAGVPFMFKQWGEWTAHEVDPEGTSAHLCCIDAMGRECALSRGADAVKKGEPWWHLPAHPGRGTWGPDGIPPGVVEVRKTGKKAAGRLLDGRTHDGFPTP